ncbi:MAG TPA: hypothetical protein VFW58_07835, partial [Trichococcus sp.]|nr:hypothetical protein [Trichococcus sp.]
SPKYNFTPQPFENNKHLNRSLQVKIMPLDLFPRTDIFTIFAHTIFTLKSKKAFISRLFRHPSLNL